MGRFDDREKRMTRYDGFFNFDRLFHRGKTSRIFATSMILLGIVHLAMFTYAMTEWIFFWLWG